MKGSKSIFGQQTKELIQKWLAVQNIPNIFAYHLDIKESKYLKGSHKIYMQLNPNRINLRRAPETIETLKPTFNENKFNFKKIQSQEILMCIPYESSEMSIIINKSPLTNYHTLICPDVYNNLPQYITMEALKFSIEWLRSIALMMEPHHQHFRIGYNSPGALASVNHLHLHLLYIENDLYIDQVKLQPLKGNDIFSLSDDMPTKAICWLFYETDTSEFVLQKIEEIYRFLQWLCEENMPHNLFLTPQRLKQQQKQQRSDNVPGHIKLFIYVRDKFCIIKQLNSLNIGFCELSGFVTVGDKQLYDDLTEQEVLNKINDVTGHAFQKVYNYFVR